MRQRVMLFASAYPSSIAQQNAQQAFRDTYPARGDFRVPARVAVAPSSAGPVVARTGPCLTHPFLHTGQFQPKKYLEF